MRTLTLYYFPGCPYCAKVLDFMKQHNINVPLKNIHEGTANRDELIKTGGKGQVPCLVIDGKALYESMDIIDWLRKNIKQ